MSGVLSPLIEKVLYVTYVRVHDVVLMLQISKMRLRPGKLQGCDEYDEGNSELRKQFRPIPAGAQVIRLNCPAWVVCPDCRAQVTCLNRVRSS